MDVDKDEEDTTKVLTQEPMDIMIWVVEDLRNELTRELRQIDAPIFTPNGITLLESAYKDHRLKMSGSLLQTARISLKIAESTSSLHS
ncbi:hypothetical protein PHLCEN_2v10292 [Hermanssonia centrifuga]|uniref:Uncharacterized protein n=1 Tax=Hermanssonia centrifuga TaxID=98765 RepID=A0A2R6NN96_9APHY|nr:hypothetical protein PHLCEN_2v10292 [Hermanssonia centrifuga]